MTEPTWHAIHIFYAASRRGMMTEAIKPLVDGLRADGLLDSYFFINYWLEGPHVRLRLKPSSAAATEEVLARARQAIGDYLRRRPALYEVRSGFMSDMYNAMFDQEFTPEQRQRYVDAENRMRIRPNNTFSDEPYEPEYGKYGGPAGVAVAEWHFERSSDLVIEAIQTLNLHLRRVLLGVASQLMMVMTSVFLPERELACDFLERYRDFWQEAFSGTTFVTLGDYERSYEMMGVDVAERLAAVREAVVEGRLGDLPEYLAGWAEHCVELRGRILGLIERGELVLRSWDNSHDEHVTEPVYGLVRLLSPYLHMTNNRMHVTLSDEAYLASVLANVLRETVPA